MRRGAQVDQESKVKVVPWTSNKGLDLCQLRGDLSVISTYCEDSFFLNQLDECQKRSVDFSRLVPRMGRCQLAGIVVNAFDITFLYLDGRRDGGSLNGGNNGESSSDSAEDGGDGELHLEIRDAFFLGWREGRGRFEEVGGYGVFVWRIEEEEESLCNEEKTLKNEGISCLFVLFYRFIPFDGKH